MAVEGTADAGRFRSLRHSPPYQLSFNSEFRMLVVMFPYELLNCDRTTWLRSPLGGSRAPGVGGLFPRFW
jgi:hypothetical protein